MKSLFEIGRYFVFLTKVFARPEKGKMYFKRFFEEIYSLGINSLGIVTIISVFMGMVITLQTAYNLENPLIPEYLVGLTTRDSMILEFSSTIVGLILAGKVGSNIASEIGTMQVTEQIDALEIMGVNPASFLVMPKIFAFMFILPFLVIFSIFIGVTGGFIISATTNVISIQDYLYGIHYAFNEYYVTYTLIKSVFFAFIITSVSSYFGYYTKGGALEVGRASTKGVVYSSIFILLFNYILTQLLLT